MATASFASVACCKEEENFTRMQMTIKKVCHKVLREYLVKKVYNIAPSVSIDHFLATNRTCLTRGRYGRLYEKRYFPLDANNQPIPTNLQDWDIQMLSFTLNNCCNLSQAETDDIDFIKDKRNYLCHLGKPEVADHLYTAFRSALVGTFKRMFSFLGNSKFEEEIKEDLETVDNRLPEHLVDFYKANHRENVETLEKFDIVQQELNNIRSEQSEHKQITETNTETLKKILDVLEEIYSVTPDNAKDKLELPEISAGKIIAKNCRNKQEEEKVTDAVVQSFSRNGLNDRIGNPLQRCIEKLKIMYGLVTSLGRGCIEFSIKFNTLQSSLCYIKDVVAGTLDSMLLPLQDALRQEVHNDSLELKVIMTDAQFAEYITTACIALKMPMYDSVAINTESHSRHSIHPSEISVVPSQRRSNEVTILSPYTGTPGALGKSSSTKLIVATVDIGTSYSGYAFSFEHEFQSNPLKIFTSEPGDRSKTRKKPTKILLTPDELFHSFGFEAEAAYVKLVDKGEQKDWFYFENIKIQLEKQKNVSTKMQFADVTGKEMKVLSVFTMIITYFKDVVHRKLETINGTFRHNDIKWVLTIPAIWNDSAKRFMWEAAIKAGIDGNSLQLRLEAEAGSIYCKTLALQTPTQMSPELCLSESCFVLLDLGGDTVNVTVYEVEFDAINFTKFREIHKAGGEDCGGNMVNDAYIEMLRLIVGKDILQKYQQDNQGDFFEIQNHFESKKRKITKASQTVRLRFPLSFASAVEELTGRSLPSLIRKAGLDGDIDFTRGTLSVSGNMFLEFFKSATKHIVSYLRKHLHRVEVNKFIANLLLVGGFAESPVVRNALQDAFPHITMYCPEDAELAIMKGAVILGHLPKLITEV